MKTRLSSLAKCRKLFEALCEPHDERKVDGEHAWRECRTCLAREELEYDSTVPLIQLFVADYDRLCAEVAAHHAERERVDP